MSADSRSLPFDAPRWVSPHEGHVLWAASYEETPNALLALEERTLGPLLPDLRGKSVLDLACGTGRWLERLSARGASAGAGLDFCAPMLERAGARPAMGGRLVLGDCLAMPFRPAVADLAICSFAVAYLFDLARFVGELARVLRRGAQLFVSDFHPSAHARGWHRTFRSGGSVIGITSSRYSIEEACRAFVDQGFELQQLLEPGFGEPEGQIFRSADKGDLFDAVCGVPAIWVAQFRLS